jgi:peptidoglycan hydrolase-like protein with peptidoglycan-binding domain
MHISVEDDNGDPKGRFDRIDAWAVELHDDVTEPPVPPTRPTIKRGDQGEEVAVLQRLLLADQYMIVVDGDFGPATEKAVRHFQISHGAKGDGIVGPYTWELLES